jgi:hypothetical protein
MRTDTACALESIGGRPTSTSYVTRCAGDASDRFGGAPDRFLPCAGITSVGACVLGAKLFVGLEMVTMTICDTAPAIGAAVSSRAIPARATLNEIRCGGRVPSRGNTVADTGIAPPTLWEGATDGTVASTVTIAAIACQRCASEDDRMIHGDRGSDSNPVLAPCTVMAARICGVVDINH